MIAVAYTRVSTAEQAAGGISLELQAQHTGRVALARGWDLEEVYSDPGASGAEWAKRSGLQRLVRHLAAPNPPGALVVYRLDRVGRKARYIHRLLELLEQSGTVFVSTSEPQFDTSTPMGRAMLGMAAVFAEFERDTIVERVSDAMLAIAKAGRWSGKPPFGYDYVKANGDAKGKLVPNSDAPLVALAFHLYVEERLGMRVIARRLAAATGRPLGAARIAELLGRRAYEGLIEYNGETYPGQHEPIVSPQLAARARELRALRRAQFSHGERVRYLLSGILRCRLCGAPMTGCVGGRERGGLNVRLYRCTKVHQYVAGKERCRGSWLRAEKAQRLLVRFLRSSGAAEAIGAIEDPPAAVVESPEQERIRRQLEALPGRRERLVGYASRGTITEEDLAAALAGMEAEEKQLRRSLAELQRPAKVDRRQVRRLFRDIAAVLESPDVELQRKRDLLLGTFTGLIIYPDGGVRFQLAH